MKERLLFFYLLAFLPLTVAAQQQIKGRVLDGAMPGEVLIGASIQVPGTTSGTVSDLDGNFQFTMPEGKFIIQVSMIGYKTQVVNVKGKTEIEVTLQEDSKLMEEVVVVGYGTMKKRDLSGSVSQIKADELTKGGAVDVAHGLQGREAERRFARCRCQHHRARCQLVHHIEPAPIHRGRRALRHRPQRHTVERCQ